MPEEIKTVYTAEELREYFEKDTRTLEDLVLKLLSKKFISNKTAKYLLGDK